MWRIRKFSLQSGLELMTTRMIDEVLANCTTETVGNPCNLGVLPTEVGEHTFKLFKQ